MARAFAPHVLKTNYCGSKPSAGAPSQTVRWAADGKKWAADGFHFAKFTLQGSQKVGRRRMSISTSGIRTEIASSHLSLLATQLI
jgi:hypothetical protein